MDKKITKVGELLKKFNLSNTLSNDATSENEEPQYTIIDIYEVPTGTSAVFIPHIKMLLVI